MRAVHLFAAENYLPGVDAFVKSFRLWDEETEIILTTDADYEGECRVVRPDKAYKSDGWPKAPFTCVHAFGFTEYDRIIFMQPDMLITGDVKRITRATLPEFGAVPDYVKRQPDNLDGMLSFNDGLMVVKPSEEMRDGIKAVNGRGGQAAANEWAAKNKRPTELPYSWNISKRWFGLRPNSWNDLREQIINVHYTGPDKPWMDGEDPTYKKLNDVWRSYAAGVPCKLPEA